MERMGLEEGQELEHPLLNRSIEQAQKRVEGHHFQQRKRTLEYDDVMNKQREVIYGFRNEVIQSTDVRDRLMDIMEEIVLLKVQEFTDNESDPAEWNICGLSDWVNMNFPLGLKEDEFLKAARAGKELPVSGSLFDGLSESQFSLFEYISRTVRDAYDLKVSLERPEMLASIERYTILTAIDRLWQEHLYSMDSLRSSIGLRAYAQRDPLIEYKAEAFKLFDELMVNIKTEVCHNIFRSATSLLAFEQFLHNLPQVTTHPTLPAFRDAPSAEGPTDDGGMVSEANEMLAKAKPVKAVPRVGRNDPCPCGSGKKYKNCCGK
jgi:preprotein translocase subunit SecA